MYVRAVSTGIDTIYTQVQRYTKVSSVAPAQVI